MNSNTHKIRKYAGLFGAICGGLLISGSAQRAVAQQPMSQPIRQPSSQINPCPSIYYEEPHNNRVVVPRGCPPNALTRSLEAQGTLPVPTSPVPATPRSNQIPLGVGGETPVGRTPVLNPCPRVFYEEPHNNRVAVPQGCPPNAFTQQQQQQGIPSSEALPASPQTTGIQPPLPEQQQAPSMTIALVDGRVNVKLVNDSGAEVTYQVIGDTSPRSLEGRSDATLQGLQAPVTMTFYRKDGGLLEITPQPSAEPGMMEVRLNETTDVAQDINTIQIQNDGTVLLN
ncbi:MULTISPECIES: hypothetical protein [unclassified Anabaena]|uniref:hypothetical protein n=1 Tax=unclassified Anabaena TaxID=2619674 RepID=UPI0039C6C801